MNTGKKDVAYQVITDRIVNLLEQGTVPWHKPWGGAESEPKNLVSKKAYRGINTFLLGAQGYGSPYWLSFKQCKDKGGSIRKGEKSTPVVFWKISDFAVTNEETGEREMKKSFLLRYYNVFNVVQCEGVDAPIDDDTPMNNIQPIPHCEQLVADMPNAPAIRHGEARAYFRPSSDTVNMPPMTLFESSEEYYSTLFHELTHSTGHEKRLNRPTLVDMLSFGDTNYSKEELVAEMGAAYLCGIAGIENRTIDNSAAYIQGWLSRLKDDKKLVIQAAAQAQKAVDYITAQA